MNTFSRLSPLDRWRQQFGGTRVQNRRYRPLAALGYLARGPIRNGLIDVAKLLLVVLHDEANEQQRGVRLAGYSGARVPWGVAWGGPDRCRFQKNLLLQPVPGGPGLRLDADRTDLLRLGLQLDRELDRHVRHPSLPVRQRLRLPCLWAAFEPADADAIAGDGPELAAYCQRTSKPAWRLMEQLRREHNGLMLLPMSWVSHGWQQAVAVLADLERFPKHQVFRLRHPAADLVGYQDAAEYDFHESRWRQQGGHRQAAQTACVTL